MTRRTLFTVPPPEPQPDIIAATLHIPLTAVAEEHVGRKLRLNVQVITLDDTGTKALVTCSTPSPRPTLVVDLAVALMGHSPASTDVSYARDPTTKYLSNPRRPPVQNQPGMILSPEPPPFTAASVPRKPLSLAAGEWITVVGWLEPPTLGQNVADSVSVPGGFMPPPRAVLEAIHVAPAREPPQGMLYRGQVS